MFDNRYCPICKAEITIRYHIEDKNFRIIDGKIIRDDALSGGHWDTPELIFECSNDREHEVPEYTKWEEPISEEFYRGAYYE